MATEIAVSSHTAQATFTVSAPVQPTNINVIPTSAAAGQNVQVIGSGFTPGGTFSVTIGGTTA